MATTPQPDPLAQGSLGQQLNQSFSASQPQAATPAPQSAAQTQIQPSGGPPHPHLILADLVKGLINPKSQQSAGNRPTSRADVMETFLGNFMQALGSGLQAAHGPGAALKGAGAAIGAPYQQSLERYQLGNQGALQQAQAGQTSAEAQLTSERAKLAGQMVTLPNGMMVPYEMAQKMAPALFSAQGRVQAAQTAGELGIQREQVRQGIPIPISEEERQQLNLPPGTTSLPLEQYKKAVGAQTSKLTNVRGANDEFQLNKLTGKKTALGVGNPQIAAKMAGAVQVADPNNPGNTKYVPMGEAIRQGMAGASSASVKVPASVMKDFTSGTSAKTLNSFNTATDHLKILSDLGDALDNGNYPRINAFANKFATATGGAAPTTFNMAKQAVAGEIAKTFKGVATEGEIESINKTLSDAQSPAQMKGAINTALTLMNSKRQALLEQYDQGIKGAPAFPKANKSTAIDGLVNKYAAGTR